jgi:hypothetical protein
VSEYSEENNYEIVYTRCDYLWFYSVLTIEFCCLLFRRLANVFPHNSVYDSDKKRFFSLRCQSEKKRRVGVDS